jgi:hypothetical protein
MKNILQFTILLLLVQIINGCSDDKSGNSQPEEILSVSDENLSFKNEGEKKVVKITSNSKWDIEVSSTSTWYSVTPASGEGDGEITIETEENVETKDLTDILNIKTKTKSATIVVTQDRANPYFPLLTIKTENGAPIDSKENYINSTITIQTRNFTGSVDEKIFEEQSEIRGRGNSTWDLMPKKSYRLKLKNSVEVLGMPKNKHWVLLANYADKTLMRNELAFEISRRMEFAYTPRVKYVDVVLNDQYLGNYMLVEHIRVGKERVDIDELKPNDSDITGGYLLEIDERKGEPVWFQTKEAGMIFCVNRPEDIPDNQKTYISNHIQKIEDILYGKNGANMEAELPQYLDIKSFIDYLLLNELSRNVDGNLRLSTFAYKKRNDDKLYFGPVWDYDIAFGNVNYDDCYLTSGWHAKTKAPWYQKFFSNPTFEKMVKDRWKELRGGPIANMDSFIDKMAKKMNNSQARNFEKWKILGEYVWPNNDITQKLPTTYSGEVQYLKTWLDQRMNWMDQQLK